MTKTQELLSKVFGDPLEAFSPGETTELECARVWLSMTVGVVRDKADLVTKLTKRLIDHWVCLGRFESFDFEDINVVKSVRWRVKDVTNRVEKLRRSGTKILGLEDKIKSTRESFENVITMESKESKLDPVEVKKRADLALRTVGEN